MTKNVQNKISIRVNEDATHLVVAMGNENERLMGEYMVLSVIETRSNIVYLASGRQISI